MPSSLAVHKYYPTGKMVRPGVLLLCCCRLCPCPLFICKLYLVTGTYSINLNLTLCTRLHGYDLERMRPTANMRQPYLLI